MIYEYKDLKGKIKVGDKARAVKGKQNYCNQLENDGLNTQFITKVGDDNFWINGCEHFYDSPYFLEIVNEKKSWETFAVGDIVIDTEKGKAKVLAKLDDVFLRSMWNEFDKAYGWYTIAEAKEYCLTIEQPPTVPEDIVMTIPEIEAKLGVTNLKIKK